MSWQGNSQLPPELEEELDQLQAAEPELSDVALALFEKIQELFSDQSCTAAFSAACSAAVWSMFCLSRQIDGDEERQAVERGICDSLDETKERCLRVMRDPASGIEE